MKKTYIEPKNTVVKLSLETMIAGSADSSQIYGTGYADVTGDPGDKQVDMEAREVIDIPDVWEEW